ncbi:MAG: hypothetical protein RLZZ124_759, partial [Cyanobacteriota bacterium]
MTSLAFIRERQRSLRIEQLREGVAPLVRASPGTRVMLFGSLARGDRQQIDIGQAIPIAPSQGSEQ